MVARHRELSTATITDEMTIVPWLAAEGPLAYSPQEPPTDDYYFQYTWVIPGIFDPQVNRRQHYYFGAPYRENAQDVFAFWESARNGNEELVAFRTGKITDASVTAPIAVYSVLRRGFKDCYLFLQHGSYLFVPCEDQPLLHDGEVMLYRGVHDASTFEFIEHGAADGSEARQQAWERYLRIQVHVLSDSVLSFNSIHDRAKRCETGHIQDDTWMTDDLAGAHGFDIETDSYGKALWRATHQSFSLAKHIAEHKFGDNYVQCKTSLDNIRITTFFAGEYEVRIINPDHVTFLDAVGCRFTRIRP